MSESTIKQERIERDLEGTRSRLNQGLNELQEKVAPRQLAGDFVDYVRQGGGGEFAQNLMVRVRRNPVPVVLVGVGLLWLMASQAPVLDTDTPASDDGQWRRGEAEGQAGHQGEPDAREAGRRGPQDQAVEMGRHAQGAAEGVADQVQSAVAAGQQNFTRGVHGVQDEMTDRAGQLSDMAQRAGSKLKQGAQSARQGGGTLVASIIDNPLVLGAMGLTVGALLGLLVPNSKQEETALGAAASDAKKTVEDLMGRGGRVARDMADQLRPNSRTNEVDTGTSVDDRAGTPQSGVAAGHAKEAAQDGLQAGKGASRGEAEEQPAAAGRDI
jgi:hypothetical protein